MAKNPNNQYPLSDLVEHQVVHAACTQPRFMQVVGYALEPEKFNTEAAGMLVGAAQALAQHANVTDIGHATQKLRDTWATGKITFEQLNECLDYAIESEDLAHDDLEALTNLVVPMVKRTAQQDAVKNVISDFGKGAPIEKSIKELTDISEIGTRTINLGTTLDGSVEDLLFAAEAGGVKNPLPTGILEVDAMLRGGLEEAALGLIMAGSGDGKSMFLCHVAAEAIWRGLDVAYVTLELSEGVVKQRLYCNLLNMTAAEIIEDQKEAAYRFEMARAEGMGSFKVAYLSPKVTTPRHVREWLNDISGDDFTSDLLVVDYADKMSFQGKDKRQRSYEEMEDVYQGLRDICTDGDCRWLWTASQTQGRAGRKKKVDLEDVSDSMNKIRIADLVMAAYKTEDDCEEDMIRFCLPKRRNAAAHGDVGPLPQDCAHGRLVQIGRNEPW